VSIRGVSRCVPTVPVEPGAPAQSIAPTSAIAEASPIASVAATPTVADGAPLSERVVESTRHLRGLGEGDLRMIQETLSDKLEDDPQLLELAQRASKLDA
jgi:hypothetical protein